MQLIFFLAITYSSMYLGSFLIIIGITGLFLPAYFQDLKRKKYLLIHYGNCYNHISANFYI